MSNKIVVFSLTELTREAGRNRRVVIQGIDVRVRVLVVGGAGLLAAIPVMFLTYSFMGNLAFLWAALFIAAAFFAFEKRSRRGLQLTTWETYSDERRATINQFQLCRVRVFPNMNTLKIIVASSAPVNRMSEVDQMDIALTGVATSHDPVKIASVEPANTGGRGQRNSRHRAKNPPSDAALSDPFADLVGL